MDKVFLPEIAVLGTLTAMHALAFPLSPRALSPQRASSPKERFRSQFQRSLGACLRRGFSVEEAFGLIWMETYEEIPISEAEQGELYDELIRWAKMARL